MNGETSPALRAATEGRGIKDQTSGLHHSDHSLKLKCQCCGQALPFMSWDWLDELAMLLARYAGPLGISPELADFTLLEVWNHYQWLRGMGASS